MSLDIWFNCKCCGSSVLDSNITHNLTGMANAAGIYDCLWRPDENGITEAGQMIERLRAGLADLKARPDHFKKFNAKNGWGLYEHFVPFVEEVLAAAEKHPSATVGVSR